MQDGAPFQKPFLSRGLMHSAVLTLQSFYCKNQQQQKKLPFTMKFSKPQKDFFTISYHLSKNYFYVR